MSGLVDVDYLAWLAGQRSSASARCNFATGTVQQLHQRKGVVWQDAGQRRTDCPEQLYVSIPGKGVGGTLDCRRGRSEVGECSGNSCLSGASRGCSRFEIEATRLGEGVCNAEHEMGERHSYELRF